jgi:hypothetical protein
VGHRFCYHPERDLFNARFAGMSRPLLMIVQPLQLSRLHSYLILMQMLHPGLSIHQRYAALIYFLKENFPGWCCFRFFLKFIDEF